MSSTLPETQEGTAYIQIARCQVELNESLGAPVHLFASQMQFSKEVAVIEDLFGDSFLPSVKELSNSGFDPSNGDPAGTGCVKYLEE